MSAQIKILALMVEIQGISQRFQELDKEYKMSEIYPGNYEDILEDIDEVTSNMADFVIAFSSSSDEKV